MEFIPWDIYVLALSWNIADVFPVVTGLSMNSFNSGLCKHNSETLQQTPAEIVGRPSGLWNNIKYNLDKFAFLMQL